MASPRPPTGPAGPGPGVDAQGLPVIDPTANVTAILDTAVKRIDDLRDCELRRIDDLRELGADHVKEIMYLRASYDEKLRAAETDRINAIRAVDIGAVQRAAEVSAQSAQILAAQVTASAETLRTQVQAAATAQTIALAAALDPIQKSIDDLRRAQYEAQGKQGQIVEQRGVSGAVVAAIGLGITVLLATLTVAAFVLGTR